jgi:hypothetical protein
VKTLNQVFSTPSTRRRYEVWFLRMGLADESGAWWLRYLLMNPGRNGCAGNSQGMPVQVWATWFPNNGKPETFIQGWSFQDLELSAKGEPFRFRVGKNLIEDNSCRGELQVDGHHLSWDLHYSSAFATTLSDKGWIGFSRTPHSDAVFSGQITLEGKSFQGHPLGYGLQGHNCGYRHRNFWIWTHACFPRCDGPPSTLEALVYEMPFGLTFHKAVLWHNAKLHVFRNLRELGRVPRELSWKFKCRSRDGLRLEVAIDGTGHALHVLPYLKTDCSGSFEVVNNSFAKSTVCLQRADGTCEKLETGTGAVLEMGGRVPEISRP